MDFRLAGGEAEPLTAHGLYSTILHRLHPIVWPSTGVKAAGHLQCLGTQLWVGTAPGGRVGI